MAQSRGWYRVGVTVLAGAGLCVGLLAPGGCGRTGKYRANPSPDVDTLSMSHDEIDNRLTVTNDSNARQLNRDIGYFFMLDRPSRLTPQPVGW